MARELKTAAPLLDAAERGDEPPELVRGPFTGGDGRPSEPERRGWDGARRIWMKMGEVDKVKDR